MPINRIKTTLFLTIRLLLVTKEMHQSKITPSNTNHQMSSMKASNKTVVYLLAGLGLDPLVFKHLTIKADEIHYLYWLEPQKKESLEHYAQRMANGIAQTNKKLILIGHSFGGVLMQEISKYIPTQKIILISSIKAKKEKNAGMNLWMRVFPLHQFVTQKMVLSSFKFWGPKHGYINPEAQTVFLDAAIQHSSHYFRWAISRICEWDAKGINTPIVHIHGTKDKTFPYKRITSPVLKVVNGGHLMVFNKAIEISELINQEL